MGNIQIIIPWKITLIAMIRFASRSTIIQILCKRIGIENLRKYWLWQWLPGSRSILGNVTNSQRLWLFPLAVAYMKPPSLLPSHHLLATTSSEVTRLFLLGYFSASNPSRASCAIYFFCSLSLFHILELRLVEFLLYKQNVFTITYFTCINSIQINVFDIAKIKKVLKASMN